MRLNIVLNPVEMCYDRFENDLDFLAFFNFSVPSINRFNFRKDAGASNQFLFKQFSNDLFRFGFISASPKNVDHVFSMIDAAQIHHFRPGAV